MKANLNNYISKARRAGLFDDNIASELKNAGWDNDTVQSHLKPPPTPPHKPTTLPWKWIFLLLAIVIFGGLLLGVKNYVEKGIQGVKNDLDNGTIVVETAEETTPTSIPTPSSPLIDGTFSKRITPLVISENSDNLLWQMLIPEEITNMNNNQLIGLSCKKYESGDPEGQAYITAHDSTAITICDTENGTKIAINETASGGGGGGANNFVQVGYLDETQSFVNPIEIHDPYTNGYAQAYFGCYAGPLALTTGNDFYFSCGGGAIQVVFVANLDDSTLEVVRKCYETKEDSTDEILQTCE